MSNVTRVDAESAQQRGHGGVVQHLPGGRGEQQTFAVEQLRGLVEDLERPGRERHPVLPTRLHALGRDSPDRTRRAVSRLVDQMGSSTAMTSAVVIASTRLRARRALA